MYDQEETKSEFKEEAFNVVEWSCERDLNEWHMTTFKTMCVEKKPS